MHGLYRLYALDTFSPPTRTFSPYFKSNSTAVDQSTLIMVKTLEDGLAAARKYKESAKNANSTKGLAAPGVDDFTADIAKIVPDLKDLTREMIFTQVYSREELSMKFRAIVVLSSLITQGVEPEIAIHVHTGLNVGLTPNDITNLAVNLWVPKAGASLSIECA